METTGNYQRHAKYWDWGGQDRTPEHAYWLRYAARYGTNVLIPMCALGETGAYMAERGFTVSALDATPEMIAEGRKRYGSVQGLRFFQGDVTDFELDTGPADFSFCMDFGHLPTIGAVQRALACIGRHLREGGGLVVETTLRPEKSHRYPMTTYLPERQVYPGLKVWKTGEGHVDAQTGRHYIAQTFYAQGEDGRIDSFEHSFYLQCYSRDEWLSAFDACGYVMAGEYRSRELASWQSGSGGFWMAEAVKRA